MTIVSTKVYLNDCQVYAQVLLEQRISRYIKTRRLEIATNLSGDPQQYVRHECVDGRSMHSQGTTVAS
jgi:hypothetical protein